MTMISIGSLYSCEHLTKLEGVTQGSSEKVQFGTIHSVVEVRRCRDVANLKDALVYHVTCTHRVIIPNPTIDVLPVAQWSNVNGRKSYICGYTDYPALLIVETSPSDKTIHLLDHAPKTINTSVAASKSETGSSGTTTSHEHTSGSSSSTSNSFGVSVSAGFMMGGISASYDHSTTDTHSSSASAGGGTSHSASSSGSATMSLKEWAATSFLKDYNSETNSPQLTWVWGQEYPWNALQFFNLNHLTNYALGIGYKHSVILPEHENKRLSFTNSLYTDHTANPLPIANPPSQLSLFGIDFSMKSIWLTKPESTGDFTIANTIRYVSACHYGGELYRADSEPGVSNVYMNPRLDVDPIIISLDLFKYGLDPIAASGGARSAITGFLPNKFIQLPQTVTPSQPAIPFKIIGPANNILVEDTTSYPEPVAGIATAGFTAHQSCLNATMSSAGPQLQITASFKIIDEDHDYNLIIKSWISGKKPIELTITINDMPDVAIVKTVSSAEGEGGEDNLLTVSLRKTSLGFADYHDFLKLGMNTITIGISIVGTENTDGDYNLRAIAIERS